MTDVTSGAGGASNRDRIIDAFMTLLATQPIERISIGDVARQANVSLGELRDQFSSVMGILGAHMKAIDRKVLQGGDADMAAEEPREKLFDVLMRRIEALTPHKQAIHSLMRSASRNPGLAMALNGLSVRSQQWMLTAADIRVAGPKGALRAQGLALLFASVLRTWIHDEDPGLARTMAALDRQLSRGARWSGFLDDICAVPERFCGRRTQRSRRRRDSGDAPIAA